MRRFDRRLRVCCATQHLEFVAVPAGKTLPPPPPRTPHPSPLSRCNELIGRVLSAPHDASVVQLMDDISDEVKTGSSSVC